MSVKYLFLLTSQGAGRGGRGRECREDQGESECVCERRQTRREIKRQRAEGERARASERESELRERESSLGTVFQNTGSMA
jgi:hypothetical protein